MVNFRYESQVIGRCPVCQRASIVRKLIDDTAVTDTARTWVPVGWYCTADPRCLYNIDVPITGQEEPLPL